MTYSGISGCSRRTKWIFPQHVIGGVGLVASGDVGREACVPHGLLVAFEEVPVPVGDGPSLPGQAMPPGGVEKSRGELIAAKPGLAATDPLEGRPDGERG